ncbi:MAG: DUF1236 domain-containing protein [Bacteroidota bacterium]
MRSVAIAGLSGLLALSMAGSAAGQVGRDQRALQFQARPVPRGVQVPRAPPQLQRAPQFQRIPQYQRLPQMQRLPRLAPRTVGPRITTTPRAAARRGATITRRSIPQGQLRRGPQLNQGVTSRRQRARPPPPVQAGGGRALNRAQAARRRGPTTAPGTLVQSRQQAARATRAGLTDAQRAELRKNLDLRRGRLVKPRFAHRIGSRIPRRVRLHRFSPAIIALIPAYAAYRYVVIDDTPYIVDPASYEIVDMLDAGPIPFYGGGGSRPVLALDLTPEQIALVRGSISPDFPPAPVSIGLALGAAVPKGVELYNFPPIVLRRVQKLRGLRFVVVDHKIVIVEPRTREVVLIIDGAGAGG